MYYVSMDFPGKVLFVDVVWTKLKLSLPLLIKSVDLGPGRCQNVAIIFLCTPTWRTWCMLSCFHLKVIDSAVLCGGKTLQQIGFSWFSAMPFCVQKTLFINRVCNMWWLNLSRKDFNSSQNLCRTLYNGERVLLMQLILPSQVLNMSLYLLSEILLIESLRYY